MSSDSTTTAITLASVEFNTHALAQKALKESEIESWMKKNLEQGIDKDWEYTYVIWKRPPPKDKADWAAQLLDPGTMKIAAYMGCRFDHGEPKDWIVEYDKESGRLAVRMKVMLKTILPILYYEPYSRQVVEIYPPIGEGVGACTTDEKRFKVKWENYTGRGLIASGQYTEEDLMKLRKTDRLVRDDPDVKKALFFMPDPEAAGAYNSLIKMSAKRAEMDAVFQIPSVAQRFSQELDITTTELDDKGNRVIDIPEEAEPEKPVQEADWDEKLAGEIEMKYRLTPKHIQERADDIIQRSSGLITNRKMALGSLKKTLEKEAAKPASADDEVVADLKKNISGAFSKAPTWVDAQVQRRVEGGMTALAAVKDLLRAMQRTPPAKEELHDIPDDLLELATEVSKATGKSLKDISDAMEYQIANALGLLTSEAALHLIAGGLGAPIGTGVEVDKPDNALAAAILEELSRLNLPTDLDIQYVAADEELLIYPKKFLGDMFVKLKDYLEQHHPGTEWVRAGSKSHFKVPV